MFLPYIGSKRGTILFSDLHDLHNLESETHMKLEKSGYGYSVLWNNKVIYDRQSAIKMFSEWGWSGPADQRPSWMIDIPDDEE